MSCQCVSCPVTGRVTEIVSARSQIWAPAPIWGCMRLRVDPWEPDYGPSVELDDELVPAAGLDLTVEQPGAWEPLDAPARDRPSGCAFVDGVRRIEERLFAEEGDLTAAALAGSWAVGCAWSTRPPRVGDVQIDRELVVGGGLRAPALTAAIGRHELVFRPRSVAGSASVDPLRGLQNAMREAEAALARRVLDSGDADLVVADGPLGYVHDGPLVGMVKRQSRSYLDVTRSLILGRLAPGERTPMFKLGEQRLERYSWYLRLAAGRPIDGAMAGLVRLEVAAASGLAAARELAALASGILPLFASQPGHDARAPQNLYPVGALEAHLRHRLGDAALIRRALEARLYEEVPFV